MKRVLITGATGFIGRHCLPTLLASGYEVHTASTRATSANLPDVHVHQADLLEPAQVAALLANVQPSHLLHLAWYTQPGSYWTSLENIRWVQASLDLLQTFVAHGGQRVVMAGSCAEYDLSYGYCAERITPLRPTTMYGKAKHALQLLEDAFAEQTQISAAWGRLFFLYGPHEYPERLVAAVIRALLQKQPARCSHGNQIRDFLYVQDAANAFVALLESDVRGAVNIMCAAQ
jgi:nucleoside-diphosphate-sugar epimerase